MINRCFLYIGAVGEREDEAEEHLSDGSLT